MSLCASCQKPLTLEVDDDDYSDNEAPQSSSSPTTIPDDVHLSCGDHFHWQCLLDAYSTTQCPSCARDITTGIPPNAATNPQILVNLNNEGGLQEGLDIFDLLQEESYLRAYPEERKCRAFLEFCREGDHKAIIQLLQSGDSYSDSDDDDAMQTSPSPSHKSPAEILRYQDPLGSQQSGLHAAAANGHREVAWLLLLLASEYPELEFPALVFQEAASLGIMREDQEGLVDIRSLVDAGGRTAEDVAVQEGGVVWNGWIGNGRLRMP